MIIAAELYEGNPGPIFDAMKHYKNIMAISVLKKNTAPLPLSCAVYQGASGRADHVLYIAVFL